MNDPLPDPRLQKLAKLVGETLAKRWMKVLADRRRGKPTKSQMRRRQARES